MVPKQFLGAIESLDFASTSGQTMVLVAAKLLVKSHWPTLEANDNQQECNAP
jgi:hypothetical protein